MKKEGFKYFAFISYSHKDKNFARILLQYLERYRLPPELHKLFPTLPENLSPIFIDEDNPADRENLIKALHAILDVSEYLILICTPNSAKSEYVNDEAGYFIRTGRADHIIPLIADGTPNSEDPAEECYPPEVLKLSMKQELAGIDLRKFGSHKSFLRIIATMLGLDEEFFVSSEESN